MPEPMPQWMQDLMQQTESLKKTTKDTIPYVSLNKLPMGVNALLQTVQGGRYPQYDSIANFYNTFVKYKNERIKKGTDQLPPEKIKMPPEELDWRNKVANARITNFPFNFDDFMVFVRNVYKGKQSPYISDTDLKAVSRKNFARKYYGVPYDTEMIVPSKHTPTIRDEQSKPNFEFGDKYRQQFINELKAELTPIWFTQPKLSIRRIESPKRDLLQNLGKYKIQRGEDEKGKYTAVLDPWDLSYDNPLYNTLTKLIGVDYDSLNFPWDFYTRVYDDEINPPKEVMKFKDYVKTLKK